MYRILSCASTDLSITYLAFLIGSSNCLLKEPGPNRKPKYSADEAILNSAQAGARVCSKLVKIAFGTSFGMFFGVPGDLENQAEVLKGLSISHFGALFVMYGFLVCFCDGLVLDFL